MRRLAIVLVLALLASACHLTVRSGIGPPIRGSATTAWGWNTHILRDGPLCDTIKQVKNWDQCKYHPYPAVDLRAPAGTPVLAVESGRVVITDIETDDDLDAWPRSPGRFVLLDHRRANPGYTPPEYTRYSHLSSIAVTEGQWVKRGTVIGRVGDTQAHNFHLHFDAFENLVDFTPAGGFNSVDYSTQAHWGWMNWCDGGHYQHAGPWSFGRGVTSVNMTADACG